MPPAPHDRTDKASDKASVIRHARKAREFVRYRVEWPKDEPRPLAVHAARIVDEGRKDARADEQKHDSRSDKTEYVVFGRFVIFAVERAFFHLFFQHEKRRTEREYVHEPVPA